MNKTIKLKLTGHRPLVMHNGLMADPTNPYTRRIKEITSKGSKKLTEADYEERDRRKIEKASEIAATRVVLLRRERSITKALKEHYPKMLEGGNK